MKRVLIVEDELPLLEVYAMLFRAQKFEVYEASHGKIALDQLDTIQPDLIILDVLMPVMGGIEFLETASIKERFPSTKILALSNLSDAKTVRKIKSLGADECLLKSGVSPAELLEAVGKLLKL